MDRLSKRILTLLSAMGLIAVGTAALVQTSTVAFFTTATTNPSNTFSSQQITFTNTPNGGAGCTAGPGTTNNPQTGCGTLVTLSNLVPGDSKLGRVTLSLASGASEAPVTNFLSVTATTSSGLDTTAVGSDGLGLLVFRCYSASSTAPASVSTVADCGTAPGAGNSLYLFPVYPTASGTPCTNFSGPTATDYDGNTTRKTLQLAANTALGTSLISTPNNAANQNISITGASATAVCVGGNIVTSPTQVPLGGPAAVTGVISTGTSAQSQGLTAGNSDFLASIVYLPTGAGNSLQNLSSTVKFTWTAEQKVGASQ